MCCKCQNDLARYTLLAVDNTPYPHKDHWCNTCAKATPHIKATSIEVLTDKIIKALTVPEENRRQRHVRAWKELYAD